MRTRILQSIAAVLGLTGVALGAAGAHALKPALAAGGHLEAWQTAVQYHLIHAVAVFAVALAGARGIRPLTYAALCWTIGVVLFSGSIYGLSLGGPRWLGPVTPIGGLALLCGWGLLLFTGKPEATSSGSGS